MSFEQIQQLELSIEEAKEVIKFGKRIDNLMKNKDFIAVIEQGYLTEEVLRLSLAFANPNLREDRDEIGRDIHACGSLKAYLANKRMHAQQMASELEYHMTTLEELREEEGDQ